ncbi:tetratricopeptide repeat protein [Clostridium saccharoperbutylacetonicum]|uniref:tetratricopeptide repeat protein n=1 Tax=Clostridium saccharoperbutylacetonicum TaxID=36745 RepID=UPI000983A668|nr:hypothetical protein [Clostridium saccharoperbutylacetonicum]AQR92950.1 lipoprotein NlpI [Clostridium saccharoperbutylacetonicum]NSB34361.1 tetratricopeptide (TPR) repeat protein [Clostridium saccharoperbutylacetonicum]
MGRIQLPGKEKNKKILLVILVLVALGIIFHEKIGNIYNSNSKNNGQEEMLTPTKIEEADSVNNTTKKEDVEVKNNDAENKNAKDNTSTEENELYNEAYNLFFAHEYEKSINKAKSIIDKFPSSAKGYNIMGISKAYNGDYDGAMKDIDKALSINASYGYARFNKALTYELFGKMDEALEWYNKDLEIENYVWSYYGIASIYGRKGDVKNTMVNLNKAIQLDAGVKEVAKAEHDFDPVKDSEEFKKVIYN